MMVRDDQSQVRRRSLEETGASAIVLRAGDARIAAMAEAAVSAGAATKIAGDAMLVATVGLLIFLNGGPGLG